MTTVLRANENLKQQENINKITSNNNKQTNNNTHLKKIEMSKNNNSYIDNINNGDNNNYGIYKDNENEIINKNYINNNNNNNNLNNNNKITIFDIPIEILFHIFTIENNENYYKISTPIQVNCRNLITTPTTPAPPPPSNNSSDNLPFYDQNGKPKNYNNYNKIDIIKMIIQFSKTCKYFSNIFQDDRFWFKSYKDFYSNYSLVDIDQKCLSSLYYSPVSSSLSSPIDYSPILKSLNNNNNNDNYQHKHDKLSNNSNNIDENDKEINNNHLNYSNYNSYNDDNHNEQQYLGNEFNNLNYKINKLWKNRFIERNYKWNLNNINCKKEILGQKGITSLEVDNNYLYSGSHDTNINLYSLEDLKSKQLFKGHESTIWSIKSDGKRLYSGSNDQTIRIWDLKTKECKSIIRDNTKIFSIAVKENLIFSSSDKTIKVWNRKNTYSTTPIKKKSNINQLVTTLSGHDGGINTIQLKDYQLYSGSSDGCVGIWDLNQMKLVNKKVDPVDKILSLKLINSNTIVTGSQNCSIKFWDLRKSENRDTPIVSLLNAHKWEVWQLELCGGYLFSGSFDHTIKVWDLNNFKNLKTISSHRSYIHALTSSSFHLFSGSADKFIKVWKADD